jgi:DNA-binding NarL/FixJ family response regulator
MIRIVLADDHTMFREGLSVMLQAAPDMKIVGTSSTGRETRALIRSVKPDIAIIDLSMPDGSGLEVLTTIEAEGIPVRIIVLTMHNTAASADAAMNAGAAGFIPKDNAFEDLLDAIRQVYAGGTFVSSSVAEAHQDGAVSTCAGWRSLTPKEIEILRLIVAGLSNKAIAERLQISVKTVETHRSRIMEKLNIHKATDLVRYALQHGLS